MKELSTLFLSFYLPATSTSFPHSSLAMGKSTLETLKALGIELPPAPKAAANYLPCQRDGNLLYLSGHLPLAADGTLTTGVIGPDQAERGYNAARTVGLNMLATLNEYLQGDLDRVEQVVKLFGIVQSTSDFHEQHKVVYVTLTQDC
jgi:enamine deaminase RidA (YjgF/YER057c/UK114 family)